MVKKVTVGYGDDMIGDLVPLKWLNAWAENPRIKESIDTSSLLCPHKKLAFNKVFMTRLVSYELVIAQ